MTITSSTTLAAAVTAHPEVARELEHRGLDYCCGGQRTLAEACQVAGLDLEEVLADLSAVSIGSTTADWATMAPDALVDHLELVHHRYLWAELPRLVGLVDRLIGAHGDRHPELHRLARCLDDIRREMEPHLRREEMVLFPMIRELAAADHRGDGAPAFHCGSVRNPISVMLTEHDQVGELLAELRAITDGYRPPADGCATYTECFRSLARLETDTHLHVHKENNLLFPAVLALEQRLIHGG